MGSEDKFIYCYNPKDGKLKWKYRTNGRVISSAVITDTKVLATGMDGYVYILGLTDGKKIWSFNTGTPVSSSPAVVKGRFYILTEDGRLMAFGEKQEELITRDDQGQRNITEKHRDIVYEDCLSYNRFRRFILLRELLPRYDIPEGNKECSGY